MGRVQKKPKGNRNIWNPVTNRYSRRPIHRKPKQLASQVNLVTHVQHRPVPVRQQLPDLPNYDTHNIPTSSHYSAKDDVLTSWKEAFSDMQTAYFESQIPNDCCCMCKEKPSELASCKDCNPNLTFCRQCCLHLHQEDPKCLYHKPMVYTDRKLEPLVVIYKLKKNCHKCSRFKNSYITVVDSVGRFHKCNIQTCSCEEAIAATFLRNDLWPSSPTHPKIGFHMEFMKWLQYLMIEAHASLQSLCHTVRWKNNLPKKKGNKLYKILTDECFEEYRHFAFQVNSLNNIYPNLDDGKSCVACPKEKGTLFVSLDANFGLVRKHNAGSSSRPPKHGTRFFAEDTDVFSYVEKANKKPLPNECSNFQAGSLVRSKNKASKLALTGVFGCACRHGVPRLFLNMKHGERIAYPMYVLDQLLQQVQGTTVKLNVMYDIACTLTAHMKLTKDDAQKLSLMTLALPIFHAYGHKASCQTSYSTRWVKGCGMTDGEQMERLWAFLRKMAYITKEMTPSHRVDMLSDALLHYAHRQLDGIDDNLVDALDKATKLQNTTNSELQEILISCEPGITQESVQEWIDQTITSNHDRAHRKTAKADKKKANWKEEYAKEVDSLYLVRESLETCEEPLARSILEEQKFQGNLNLLALERKHDITRRWTRDCTEYIQAMQQIEHGKKIVFLSKMHAEAVDYGFACRVAKRYSSGQKMAKKMNKQVSKSASILRRSLQSYNSADFRHVGPIPNQLHFTNDMISDPDSAIYSHIQEQMQVLDTRIPAKIKLQAMDTLNRMHRAVEEVDIVKDEMGNIIEGYADEHKKLSTIADTIVQNVSSYHNGVLQSILHKLDAIETKFREAQFKFAVHIAVPAIKPYSNHLICVREETVDHTCDSEEESDCSDIPSDDSDIDLDE